MGIIRRGDSRKPTFHEGILFDRVSRVSREWRRKTNSWIFFDCCFLFKRKKREGLTHFLEREKEMVLKMIKEKFFLGSFLFYFYYFSFLHHLPHFNILFLETIKMGLEKFLIIERIVCWVAQRKDDKCNLSWCFWNWEWMGFCDSPP